SPRSGPRTRLRSPLARCAWWSCLLIPGRPGTADVDERHFTWIGLDGDRRPTALAGRGARLVPAAGPDATAAPPRGIPDRLCISLHDDPGHLDNPTVRQS